MLTPHQAQYFAHELTLLHPASSVARIGTSLFDAAVDLNPHQIEAALFALRSPFSKGVLLADEVGLGKTIEAGLIMSQYCAEGKRNILVVCPAALRKQWALELHDKFSLQAQVLEREAIQTAHKAEGDNPLQPDGIFILSFQFAHNIADVLARKTWDLVVIDEAHKLRNLYKKENKIGKKIQTALRGSQKLLLTATPLQNSLLELYGLASLIDEHIFGNIDVFKHQYILRTNPDFDELKKRMQPFVFRTLRRQVQDYVRYTNRISITHPFTPTQAEQELYDLLSLFILQQDSYAIPWAQRTLMVLILRKLMASSSYAIVGTLRTIKARLEAIKKGKNQAEQKPLPQIPETLLAEHELSDEYQEIAPRTSFAQKYTDSLKLESEIAQLDDFIHRAQSIGVESKAKELFHALSAGFARMKKMQAPQKALIFTESYRTQRYLKELLEDSGYKGLLVTFNGQNNDPLSQEIYANWKNQNKDSGRISGSKNIDVRQALVDYFKNQAQIMIATEAAAEGVNLQFCSLVINYDLPWNPQRVEQRIGRCHRYGQKNDVVVINFLNENNWVDKRIYQLLKEKFELFDGVFGASDEILGRIESGIDFEKRILEIYESCRTAKEIDAAFDALQKELEEPIQERMQQAREMLFEHFDEDVYSRLNVQKDSAQVRIDSITKMFWQLIKFYYHDRYYFNEEKLIFGSDAEFIAKGERPTAHDNAPIYYYLDTSNEPFDLDKYESPRERERRLKKGPPPEGYPYKLTGLESEQMLEVVKKDLDTPKTTITFSLSEHPHKVGMLEPLKNTRGSLRLDKLTLASCRKSEHLLFSVCNANGDILSPEIAEKMFLLPAKASDHPLPEVAHAKALEQEKTRQSQAIIQHMEEDNHAYFDEEVDKLDRWADEVRQGLKRALKAHDEKAAELKKKARGATDMKAKVDLRKKLRTLDEKRDKAWREYDKQTREVEQEKDKLLDNVEKAMEQELQEQNLFIIEWEIV